MENNKEPITINGEPVYEPEISVETTNKHYDGMDYGNGIDYGDGTPQSQQYPPYPPQNRPKKEENGLISMICGILGLLFMGLFPFSPALGIAAVVLANKSTNPEEESYKKVGKITGIISIVMSVLLLLFFGAIILIAALAAGSTY